MTTMDKMYKDTYYTRLLLDRKVDWKQFLFFYIVQISLFWLPKKDCKLPQPNNLSLEVLFAFSSAWFVS
jgi:hypothetical protein